MTNLEEQDEYEHIYEVMNVPEGMSTSFTNNVEETYYLPRSHQPLPAIPLSDAPPTGIGVTKNEGTSTSFAKNMDEIYSVPRSHQPLPAIPLGDALPTGMGVTEEEDTMYY